MSKWIHDSSNLVCKRRKVPHTRLDAWRAHRITYFHQNLMEPVIPCKSTSLPYFIMTCNFGSAKSLVSLQMYL